MTTLIMSHNKTFKAGGADLVYGEEVGCHTFEIILPTYCLGHDLREYQTRLCFAMGQNGDIALLEDPALDEEGQRHFRYEASAALTRQAGEYDVWVEFWQKGETPYDEPTFFLKSGVAKIDIRPHPKAQDLLSRTQLTVFAQVQEKIETDLESAKEAAESAKEASESAQQAKDGAAMLEKAAEQAASNANDCAAGAQRFATNAQESADQAKTSAQSAQTAAQNASKSASDAAASVSAAQSSAAAAAQSASASAQSAKNADASAKNAAASADRANVEKRAYIRYSANADGSNFTETQSQGQSYIGIAIAQSAPQSAQDYEWFTLADVNAVTQGVKELRLENGSRVVGAKDGSVIIQPSSNDSNYSGHSYTFSVGVLNHNGGYAAVVTGYQNRTTQSQQFVSGQGNVAPVSKNLAVVGQFCQDRPLDGHGNYDPNWSRPLFVVGNGDDSLSRSNALTVYKNGETVLHYGDTHIPLVETIGTHHQLLQMLIHNAGMEGYSTLSQRLEFFNSHSAGEGALTYGIIAKLRPWSTPKDGLLQDAKRIFLRHYNEGNVLVKEETAPAFLQDLTDFGCGVSEVDCNEVDLVNGTYTRRCGVYTFTGDETITMDFSYEDHCHYNMVFSKPYDYTCMDDSCALWNFGRVVANQPNYYLGTGASFGLGLYQGDSAMKRKAYIYSDNLDVDGIKAYFKERYQSGKPIRMVYRLETPIVEDIRSLAPLQAWYVDLSSNPALRIASENAQGVYLPSITAQLQYQVKNA